MILRDQNVPKTSSKSRVIRNIRAVTSAVCRRTSKLFLCQESGEGNSIPGLLVVSAQAVFTCSRKPVPTVTVLYLLTLGQGCFLTPSQLMYSYNK